MSASFASATSTESSSMGSDQEEFMDVLEIDTGEFRILTNQLENSDLSCQLEASTTSGSSAFPLLTSLNSEAHYGAPLTEEEAESLVPPGADGLVRHAIVIPDNFCPNGKLVGGLNKRDFDVEKKIIRPRRGSLPITQTQLMSSLTKVKGPDGPRYIFNGVLNGWPSLRQFELIELEKKRTLGPLTPPDYMNSIRQTWQHHWSAEREGVEGVPPVITDTGKIYRAKLRGAPWSSIGWSPSSPGFIFWYEGQRSEPRVSYGTKAIDEVGDAKCKAIHMISHRYAMEKESPKDKLTYHSVVFLEWEHGQFGTIVEGAYLNGIGGYKGRSNWYHDKDDKVTALYKTLPPELISPWLTTATELRCYDVEAKNLDEMKAFVEQYTGPDKRFLDPQYTFSHEARLTFRTRSHIAQYLINYISRDCSYSQLKRNCQTLAADLCAFLAGKRKVVPYHPINRVEYKNRAHFFMYDSNMYSEREKGNLKGKVAM